MAEPITLAAGGLALWLWMRRKTVHTRNGFQCTCKVGFDRLERSSTAARLGIDNTIPPGLLERACGLAHVVSYLESQGHRVTSIYRSLATTEAIYRESGRTKYYSGPGAHGECRAIDLGASGEDLVKLAAVIEGDLMVGEYVTKSIPEGNHLHLEFSPSMLEALGGGGEWPAVGVS